MTSLLHPFERERDSLADADAHGGEASLAAGPLLEACGGSSGTGPEATAELYDPRTGSWTATANMNIARGRRDTFTLLQDGTVLAAGGVYNGALAGARGGDAAPLPIREHPVGDGDDLRIFLQE